MVITIDTNILINAFKNSEPDHIYITSLIGRDGRFLGFDRNQIILDEYRRNVGSTDHYQKWINRLQQLQAIHCSGKYDIPNSHKVRLKELQCHEPSDLVFIGVAFYSGKILISEDSDVGKGPKGHQPPHCHALDYLTKKMGLSIWDANEACGELA